MKKWVYSKLTFQKKQSSMLKVNVNVSQMTYSVCPRKSVFGTSKNTEFVDYGKNTRLMAPCEFSWEKFNWTLLFL